MFRAMAHYLMLPWPGLHDNEQDWEVRSQNLVLFLNQTFATYKSLQVTAGLADNRSVQEQGESQMNMLGDGYKQYETM